MPKHSSDESNVLSPTLSTLPSALPSLPARPAPPRHPPKSPLRRPSQSSTPRLPRSPRSSPHCPSQSSARLPRSPRSSPHCPSQSSARLPSVSSKFLVIILYFCVWWFVLCLRRSVYTRPRLHAPEASLPLTKNSLHLPSSLLGM